MTLTLKWRSRKRCFVEASSLICILRGFGPNFQKKPNFSRDFAVFMTLTLKRKPRKIFFLEASGLICILWRLRPHFQKKLDFFCNFIVFMTLTFKWRSRKIDKEKPHRNAHVFWKYELLWSSRLGGPRGYTDRQIEKLALKRVYVCK